MRISQKCVYTMIEWRRVPLSLWAFCVLLLIEALAFVVTVSGSAILVALTPPVAFVWCYLLLRGVRWLWFATVVVSVLAILGALSGSASWRSYALTLIGVTLLLLPSTRSYFSIGESKDGHNALDSDL